jgi:hypothetical protein
MSEFCVREEGWNTYDVDVAAHVNLAACGADCLEIRYIGRNRWCCNRTSQFSFLKSKVEIKGWVDDLRTEQSRSAIPRTSTSQQFGVPLPQSALAWRLIRVAGVATELAMSPLRTKRVANEVFMLMDWLFRLELFEVDCLWRVLILFVDAEDETISGGKTWSSYSSLNKPNSAVSFILAVSSTDRHLLLKSMMPIQVHLVQLLKVEEASSLSRRHLAREREARIAFHTATHHVWVKFYVDRNPMSLLRKSCRVPRSGGDRGRTFLPLYRRFLVD